MAELNPDVWLRGRQRCLEGLLRHPRISKPDNNETGNWKRGHGTAMEAVEAMDGRHDRQRIECAEKKRQRESDNS